MRHGSSVAGVADPGAARSVKEKRIRSCRRAPHRTFFRTVFRSGSNAPDSNQCLRIRVLRDVARRPSVQAGASVPSYSGGWAACIVVSSPCFEGCGLGTKCGNRGQRTRLQWRRRRLRSRFGFGFFVAGVADPGAARSVKGYRMRRSRRAPHRTSRRTFF